MHDARVNVIVANAFNSNDVTGSDEFGTSVAWIDLDDYLESYGEEVPDYVDPDDSDSLSAWLKSWPDVHDCRYALAYIDANGTRSVVGYQYREDVMIAYRGIENEYLTWEIGAY